MSIQIFTRYLDSFHEFINPFDDSAREYNLIDRFRNLATNIDPQAQENTAFLRTHRPAHFTGSAFVVNAQATHAVLLFHTKLQKWLQPGGHADGDVDLGRVALREATEETGIAGLKLIPTPIDLDIHLVAPPKEDAHDHYDMRFVVQAPPGAVLQGNHESEAIQWVPLDEITAFTDEPSLLRLVKRGLQLLCSSK